MLTKDDFLRAIANNVAQYPTLSALYQAGDPRILQSQGAIAQMLAMFSQQIDIGMMEPFSKTRDSTLLADAALKGLVPMAVCARVRVKVINNGSAEYQLAAGRRLLDSSGNIYEVDLPVSVPVGASGFAELTQVQVSSYSHTVSASQPFYKIQVTQPRDERKISGISLFDASGNEYRYAREFTNVLPDEKVFNIECDEYRNIYIVLGYSGIVGHQPNLGEVYTISVRETAGDVQNAFNSPFTLEYSYTVADSQIKVTMESLLASGANPMDLATLRELCKYPSVYDSNAVFLGEFDFLVRRNVPDLRFLSIWNESVEESVRGANVNNINTLFVSFVAPSGVDDAAIQATIKNVIAGADDSYRVVFVPPVIQNIGVTISAQVARVNDPNSVAQSIEDALLSEYGASSPVARIGMSTPNYKRVYDLLKSKVPALQDAVSDFTVSIAAFGAALAPEQFRYMTPESIVINVTQANYNLNRWGH